MVAKTQKFAVIQLNILQYFTTKHHKPKTESVDFQYFLMFANIGFQEDV